MEKWHFLILMAAAAGLSAGLCIGWLQCGQLASACARDLEHRSASHAGKGLAPDGSGPFGFRLQAERLWPEDWTQSLWDRFLEPKFFGMQPERNVFSIFFDDEAASAYTRLGKLRIEIRAGPLDSVPNDAPNTLQRDIVRNAFRFTIHHSFLPSGFPFGNSEDGQMRSVSLGRSLHGICEASA